MITATTDEEFESQFRALFKEPDFRSVKNIIYLWRTARPIPRLLGESDILYIGRTSRTFAGRYSPQKSMTLERSFFTNVYCRAIETYGAIRIEIIESDDLVLKEATELKNYYEKHGELPPMNRQGFRAQLFEQTQK